jgi:hypothetical protein
MATYGNQGAHLDRLNAVAALLRGAGVQARHLGLTKGGQPKHPLYIGYKMQSVGWG